MKKILVICGPTATGKTSLAISLARKFNGELVSADSRQVYRGMDIGTGKDLPKGSKLKKNLFSKYGYFEIDGVKVWGYDIVDPRRDFSVAQYINTAHAIIDNIAKRNKLPILVGGTGLYIKGVIDGIATASVPPNESLRKNLENRSVSELFDKLSLVDSFRAASLNVSDRKNPRRLVRAIEIAQYQLNNKEIPIHHSIGDNFDILYIGLAADKDFIAAAINQRVTQRLEMGLIEEIKRLLKAGVKWEDQSMMSLGYRQLRDFFEGGVAIEPVIEEWAREENNYAKRQMTWFRKNSKINWFDISKPKYIKSVENLVKRWYNGTINAEKN